MSILPGTKKYPGVTLKPETGSAWDLSAYGHVEATVVNTGDVVTTVSLRLDNDGVWPNRATNAESIHLKPGASGVVKVYFGYSYGKPAPLKPDAIVQLLLFTGASDKPQTIRIESLLASGTTGEKPAVDRRSIRIKPRGGILLGDGVTIDSTKQLDRRGGALAEFLSTPAPALKLTFPKSSTEASVTFRPEIGCWDLRDSLSLVLSVRNNSDKPVTPGFHAESRTGATDHIVSAQFRPAPRRRL